MQNQNYWNDSYAATGYPEECWSVNGQTASDDLSSFSLTPEAHSAPYNDFFAYSTTPTTETTSEMPQPITRSKSLPRLDPRAEFAHEADELLELNPRKIPRYSKQTNGQPLSNSQNFSFSRTSSFDLSKPKTEEKVCSLTSDNLGIRLLSSTIDLSQDNHDSDVSEGNSYSSSCDIVLGNSNDSLSKHSLWSSCYAPNRKHPASSISSERGIDSLINKFFTDDQKKRYMSVKRKRTQKMEEKKERLKCKGIDASYRAFMGDGISTQSKVKFGTKGELEVLTSKQDEVTLIQNTDENRTVHSPMPDSNANSRLGSFFTELLTPSQNLVPNKANQCSMSLDEETSNTRIETKNVPLKTDVVNKTFEIIIENTKEQFCSVVEMDADTNISTGNFSNDEISNSLEKIFTESDTVVDGTVCNIKQSSLHEMNFNVHSEKLALSHEECIDISTKRGNEAEDSECLDTEASLYEKGISPNSESRICMEVVTSNSLECMTGLDPQVDDHSSVTNFPTSTDESDDLNTFTDKNEITDPLLDSNDHELHIEHHSESSFPSNTEENDSKTLTSEKGIENPLEYSTCSSGFESHLEHHSTISDFSGNDENNTIKSFTDIKEITDPPVEYAMKSGMNVPECEEAPDSTHYSKCLGVESDSKEETITNIDNSELYDNKVSLEESTTQNSPINFIEIQVNELYYEEQKELLTPEDHVDNSENKPNSEENNERTIKDSSETHEHYVISDNREIVSEAEEQYVKIDGIADSETCHVSHGNVSNPEEEQYMEASAISYNADSETCTNYISLGDSKDIVAAAYLQALRGNSNMTDSEIVDVPEYEILTNNPTVGKDILCVSNNHGEEQYMEVVVSDNNAESETGTNYISLEDNKDIVAVAYLQALRGNSDFSESEILDIPVSECKIKNSYDLQNINDIPGTVQISEQEQTMEVNLADGIADSFHEISKEVCNIQKSSNSSITEQDTCLLNDQNEILQYSHSMENNCIKIISKARKGFGSKNPKSSQSDCMDIDDVISSSDKPSKVENHVVEQDSNITVSTDIFINDEIECTVLKTTDYEIEQGTTEDILTTEPCQISKESFPQRTFSVQQKARKSACGSRPDSSCVVRNDSDMSSDDSNSSLPKRRKLVNYLHQASYSNADISSAFALETSYAPQASVTKTAMKTFVKPFTVAKKSVSRKSAYQSILQAYFGAKAAMKTVNKSQNQRKPKENTIEKEGSAIVVSLANENEAELSVEEVSADDSKNSPEIWSPLKDLMPLKSVCCCSADMVPCLCNGETLQLTCEAEDSIDGQTVSCTKHVNQQFLLTPSSKTKHKVLCDIHLWRLQQHHCCPKCGVFCTQGSFLLCSFAHLLKGSKESHFFHPDCLLVPGVGLPPSCPHCCRFSDFKNVQLSLSENTETENSSPDKPRNSDLQNITSDLEKYSIFMQTANTEAEKPANGGFSTVSQKQELQSMVMAIASEKSLHLRPSGKCLFNPIKNGDVKKVLQLIVNGVNPNHKFKTHKNNTPLHIGAYYGFFGIVHVLLQYGALIDAVNDDLETPLIMAVERNHLAVVRYLTFAGAQTDVKNENGLSAFHVASKNGSKEVAEFLLNTGSFDVNMQDEGGWTPLVWACENNYADYIKWLLELGADPNVRDNEENTALHWAACTGDNEILLMLLNSGCNITFVNQRGDSALHIAARKDNFQCVNLLLKRGALIDCANKEGETPILCCDDGSKSLRILKRHLSKVLRKDEISLLQQNVVYRDVSRGAEAYPIQAVNFVDEEEFIMDFRYITSNCYSPELRIVSTVDSMQVCLCRDNCSSSDCSCSKISKCWYDMNGCLLSEFDLNDPPTIFECNKTCHCPKTCINRIVQKGLKIPLQLFRTLSMGWGVRTLKEMPKGTFVCEYIGEVVTGSEVAERDDDTYLFDLESKSGDVCMDGRFYGNVARFINHSCEPNLVSVRVFIEHQDLNFPRIAFFTLRNIEAFEELCFDYGLEFWISKCQTTLCTCKTSSCKYSKDSIDDTLQSYADEKERT